MAQIGGLVHFGAEAERSAKSMLRSVPDAIDRRRATASSAPGAAWVVEELHHQIPRIVENQ